MPRRKNNFDELFGAMPTKAPGAFAGIATVVDQVVQKTRRHYGTVPLDRLSPNPMQPRQHFGHDALEALGDSILEHGLLEPLVIREHPQQADHFQIACGERRWRAMQLKGITEAEAIILDKSCTDDEMEQIALVENVQRENLSPYEIALAYDRLHKDRQGKPKRSIADVAKIVRQPKSKVDDYLSILRVPEDVRQLIIDRPTTPIRMIRDLGNVTNKADRAYLISEIRNEAFTVSMLSRILQQAKTEQAKGGTSSAYADDRAADPTKNMVRAAQGDQGAANEEKNPPQKRATASSGAMRVEVPSAYADTKPRPVSPAIALASLDQKLQRDSVQIRKITERITEELQSMSSEEKERVRNRVDEWHIWTRQILDLVSDNS